MGQIISGLFISYSSFAEAFLHQVSSEPQTIWNNLSLKKNQKSKTKQNKQIKNKKDIRKTKLRTKKQQKRKKTNLKPSSKQKAKLIFRQNGCQFLEDAER